MSKKKRNVPHSSKRKKKNNPSSTTSTTTVPSSETINTEKMVNVQKKRTPTRTERTRPEEKSPGIFLRNNRFTKTVFVAVVLMAAFALVVTLLPGLGL